MGVVAMEQEMAELRGSLHELLELSCRTARRAGTKVLPAEVTVLERVVRVWGGGNIRWTFRGR